MLKPVELEIEPFCRGLRIYESATLDEDGRRISRTRAGLGSGLELVLPGPEEDLDQRPRRRAVRLGRRRSSSSRPGRRSTRPRLADGSTTIPSTSRRSPSGTRGRRRRGAEMCRIGVLQGTYLGIYVSNSCLYWKMPALPACAFCTTGLNVGDAEESRKKVEDVVEVAKRRARPLRLDLHAPEHGLSLRGERQARVAPRPEAVRAVREGDPGRVGGFIGVQAVPVPRRKFAEYDDLIEPGRTTSRSATSSRTPRPSRGCARGRPRRSGSRRSSTRWSTRRSKLGPERSRARSSRAPSRSARRSARSTAS